MIPILVLKTENKVIYNKSNLNCKTFFEEFRNNKSRLQKKCHRLRFMPQVNEVVIIVVQFLYYVVCVHSSHFCLSQIHWKCRNSF